MLYMNSFIDIGVKDHEGWDLAFLMVHHCDPINPDYWLEHRYAEAIVALDDCGWISERQDYVTLKKNSPAKV